MYPFAKRALLVVAMLGFLPLGSLSARAQAAVYALDGVREDGYTLVAQDASGDLAASFSGSAATNWADLTDLSVATDTTNLWVYINLPNYSSASSSDGVFGLAVDTDGIANSGGRQDPMGNAITFAYTSTHNNVGVLPVTTTPELLPDVVIRGRIYRPSAPGAGYTEMFHWNASSSPNRWDGAGVNWGGITTSAVGAHIAFALSKGIELSIPFADLGVPPTTTLNLEFYATGTPAVGHVQGAWDTVPSDAQSQTDDNVATTEQHLATFDLGSPMIEPVVSFSSNAYAVFEAAGTAPITITLAPTSTRPISVTFAATNGTADPADYIPSTQTVSFGPGQASGIVPVQVLTDTQAEPDETVRLTLSGPINAQLGQPFTATLTIHDSAPGYKLFTPLLRR